MNRLRQELKIISPVAWVIAALGSIATAVCILLFVYAVGEDASLWPPVAKVLFAAGLPLIVFIYLLLASYVYNDARRRGMRHVMWTLLAIFVPNAIGFILYFIMRDPVQNACSGCGADVHKGFQFCPKCGAPLAQSCAECHRPVEPGWSHCAHCGAGLKAS